MQEYGLKNFTSFMKNKNVLSTAVSFVIAAMMKEIIFKFTNEVVLPLTKNKNLKKLKNVNIYEYFILIINLLIVSYILFIIDKSISDNI